LTLSKTKLLLNVVSDMRSLADSLQAVAEVMAGNEPVETAKPTTSTKGPEPKKSEKPKKKEITLEEVRAKLAEKSQEGLTAEVRKIIERYGGTKLSEVGPEHYTEMLKDAEALGNG
jgi:hypothetical protein